MIVSIHIVSDNEKIDNYRYKINNHKANSSFLVLGGYGRSVWLASSTRKGRFRWHYLSLWLLLR